MAFVKREDENGEFQPEVMVTIHINCDGSMGGLQAANTSKLMKNGQKL